MDDLSTPHDSGFEYLFQADSQAMAAAGAWPMAAPARVPASSR